ncbi:hypothetical protein ACOMHN_038658 [Nucella lapillus]
MKEKAPRTERQRCVVLAGNALQALVFSWIHSLRMNVEFILRGFCLLPHDLFHLYPSAVSTADPHVRVAESGGCCCYRVMQ